MTRVAILMPSCGQRALANLARDAIAAFTTDVAHDVYLLDHDPWKKEEGGAAHLHALMCLRHCAGYGDYSHVFLMHDDALPIRDGWLQTLLEHRPPAAAIVSRRSGRGHSAGTLYDWPTFRALDLRPNLPDYDVAERVPLGWGTLPIAWRGPGSAAGWEPPEWMRLHACDIALDAGRPFYVHLGGGTIGTAGAWGNSAAHRERIASWVRAARLGLGL